MNIKIKPLKSLNIMLCVVVLLLCANILGLLSEFYFKNDSLFGLVPMFNFDTERNIPTLYSAISLLVVSLLLWIIAATHKKENKPYFLWSLLSLIFIFLSIDEISSIHESLVEPTRSLFNTSGLLYFAWVIPYGAALLALVAIYLKFLIDLPKEIRILFLLSGMIFVSGAIGFELLGGKEVELNGSSTLSYAILYTCEELLEMLGIVIFIHTLLKYIVNYLVIVKITFTEN